MSGVTIKSDAEIQKLVKAGALVAMVHNRLKEHIVPGVSTLDLDKMAEEWLRQAGALPAFKGYMGYQHTLCTSLNDEVVHGIPRKDVILRSGDIVSVDCGSIWEGYYGDSAVTYGVGEIDEEAQALLDATDRSLHKGIDQMRVGNRLYDIGAAIESYALEHGYSIVREYVGHGVGTKLHEEPQVPNYGTAGTGMRLKKGMVLAIEPMLNIGGEEVELLEDGWTVKTRDRSLSAHFEHTVLITENEPQLLTKRD